MFVLATSFAVTVPVKKKPLKANEIFLAIGSAGQRISLLDLSYIKAKELQELTGRKMSFSDKVSFKVAQRQLRKSIASDGTFRNRKMDRYLKRVASGEGFQAGGFFLGLLLGLIGILIAYLINDEQKKNRVKWAWIGFGVWVLILILATI